MTPPPRRLRFQASPLVLAVALGLLSPSALVEEESDAAPEPVVSPSNVPAPSPPDSSLSS